MPDGSQTVISGFAGLFAAGLAALGMNGRMNRIERGVLFKDTFNEFKEAQKQHMTRMECKQDALELLIRKVHEDMPKRKGE